MSGSGRDLPGRNVELERVGVWEPEHLHDLFAELKEKIKIQVYSHLQLERPPQDHTPSNVSRFVYDRTSMDLAISTVHWQESGQKPCVKVKGLLKSVLFWLILADKRKQSEKAQLSCEIFVTVAPLSLFISSDTVKHHCPLLMQLQPIFHSYGMLWSEWRGMIFLELLHKALDKKVILQSR